MNHSKQETAPEHTSEENSQLNINDLINMRIFMQVMTRRGAILTEEMANYGQLYNNIDRVLKHVAPNAPLLDDIINEQKNNTENTTPDTKNTSANIITI
jgi:hypothetical protein